MSKKDESIFLEFPILFKKHMRESDLSSIACFEKTMEKFPYIREDIKKMLFLNLVVK